MSCMHIHDFINGTTIALARATASQSAECEAWDILRPNRKAAALFSQHVEALNALNVKGKPEVAIQ